MTHGVRPVVPVLLFATACANGNTTPAAQDASAPPTAHSLLVRELKLRREVLLALVRVYTAATWVAKVLGSSGLALMAASRAQYCADELAAPQWRGYTAWLRGVTTGALNRDRQYQRAVAMADELSSAVDDREVAQAVGQLHLSAALAAAAQADRDRASLHLDTAGSIADRLGAPVNDFAKVWFGKTNVGIWRVTIGLELDEGLKVAQAARGRDVEAIPSPARRAVFYLSVGRGLIGERQKAPRDSGLRLPLKAEKLAPQHIRGDVFAREAMSSLLRHHEPLRTHPFCP